MEDSSLSVDLVEPFDQVPGTQMRVSLQHPHALVAADGGHFLVGQPDLDKSARIREIMESVPESGHHFGRPFLSA